MRRGKVGPILGAGEEELPARALAPRLGGGRRARSAWPGAAACLGVGDPPGELRRGLRAPQPY